MKRFGMEFRLPMSVRFFAAEGGEGGGESKEEADVFDEALSADDYPEDKTDPNITIEDVEEEKENPEGSAGPEKKEPTISEVLAKVSALEAKNTELEKAARRAFYNERQEKKADKGKGDDATLTDAELTAIIEANKDDPKVMLNAVTYKMQQMMKAGTKAAVDEVAVKTKNDALSSYVRGIVPDYDKEGSEAHEAVSKVKTDFGLDDHPHGDFLGWAAAVSLQLPQIKQAAFEAGKKAALEGKAEDGRKADIKGGQPGPGGKKGNGGGESKGGELSATQMETAKMMGFDKNPQKMKLYRDQILRGSNSKAA